MTGDHFASVVPSAPDTDILVNITCDEGYEIDGEGMVTIMALCDENGTLINKPTCSGTLSFYYLIFIPLYI